MFVEALTLLLGLGPRARFIRGNGERELVEAFDTPAGAPLDDLWQQRTAWDAARMSAPQRDAIAAWPEQLVLEIDGLGPVRFCHGSPRSDMEMITPGTPPERLAAMVAGVAEPVVVCGHTHMQLDRVSGSVRVVNAGSVGMAYEDAPGAYWALLGPDIELRATAYDGAAAAAAIRASGYPDAGEHVATLFEQRPGRAEATAAFEAMAEG
jgi:diadenosine tetraphosphatase ApaH/serine/threonine PP2A family protein phosphatase